MVRTIAMLALAAGPIGGCAEGGAPPRPDASERDSGAADAPGDASAIDAEPVELDAHPAAIDAGRDAAIDAGRDAAVAGRDAAIDAGRDAAIDAGRDAAIDAGRDAGIDAGRDSGPPIDAGPSPTGWSPALFPIVVPGAGGFGDLAFHLNGDLLTASNSRDIHRIRRSDGMVSVYASLVPGLYALGVVYRPSDGMVYVSNHTGEIFSVSPGGAIAPLVTLADRVHSLTIAPPTFGPWGGLVIATVRNGSVVAIDPAVPTTMTIGTTTGSLSDAAFAPDGTLYLVNFTAQTVMTMTSAGVFATFSPTGFSGPDGIAIDPTGTRLWVTSSGPGAAYLSEVAIPSGAAAMVAPLTLNYGDNVTGMVHDGAGLLVYRRSDGSLATFVP
jgi:hypothetical protein